MVALDAVGPEEALADVLPLGVAIGSETELEAIGGAVADAVGEADALGAAVLGLPMLGAAATPTRCGSACPVPASDPVISAATVATAATATVAPAVRNRRIRRPRRAACPTRSPIGGSLSPDTSSLSALLNSSFISDVLLVV
jgi:hypothetical protein